MWLISFPHKGPNLSTQLFFRIATFAAHHGILFARRVLGKSCTCWVKFRDIPKAWIGKLIHSPESDIAEQQNVDALG